MSLPIVFIHKGYSSYMEYSLRQAKAANPNSEIILLGDESNNRFPFIRHVNIKDYFNKASEFAKIYKHYSTNPYNYELFCFQRWLVLEEYLLKNAYNEVFVCDTDVLIYADINEVKNSLLYRYDVGLCIYSKEHASSGIAYFTLPPLRKFCTLLFNSYTDKIILSGIEKLWAYNRANNILGGFSDMSVTTYFVNSYTSNKIINLICVHQDSTFDTAIKSNTGGESEEYLFNFGKKILKWKNRIPFCFNKTKGRDIKFNLIHFSGATKYLMAYYYKGPMFKGKIILSYKFYFFNLLAFWYRVLKIRHRFAFIFNYLNR